MKTIRLFSLLAVFGTFAAMQTASAADTNAVVKPYTLDHCMVSGDKLGEMGKPYVTNYMGQEIKFCCPDCVKDFNKDPQAYIKKINAAEAAKK
jgi:YHS domain-containing protein